MASHGAALGMPQEGSHVKEDDVPRSISSLSLSLVPPTSAARWLMWFPVMSDHIDVTFGPQAAYRPWLSTSTSCVLEPLVLHHSPFTTFSQLSASEESPRWGD